MSDTVWETALIMRISIYREQPLLYHTTQIVGYPQNLTQNVVYFGDTCQGEDEECASFISLEFLVYQGRSLLT